MNEPVNDVIPLPEDDTRKGPELAEHALWMLGVGVMVGVVLVAGLATAAIAVRAAS